MRTALAVLGQVLLLFVSALCGFMAGAAVPALRVSRVTAQTATYLRTYDFDWLIAVLVVYVILLLIAAARKRLPSSAISATVALIITIAVIVLFTQIGVKETFL